MSLTRETIIRLGNQLAPSAATFGRLRALLLDPEASLDEIAKIIRLDPALTFHVVRLSNSVLFGIREPTKDLDVAVGRVGVVAVLRLVGLAAAQQVCQRDLKAYGLTSNRLWENAVATAAAAELLAARADWDSGAAYSAGLLRTIGRVILDGASDGRVYPGEAEWPVIAEWEKSVFGLTSADVTAELLTYWRFPDELIEAIRGHRDPLADPDKSNVGACVLNLACGVVSRFGMELPGESGHWHWLRTPAKLTLAGVTEADLDECTEHARRHFSLLCSSVT